MKTHKDLQAWQNSINLVTDVYKLTESFPKEELYALTNQIRRCAVSVPSNIAEGAGRNSKKEYIQFLYVALGSLSELETQLIISQNLGFIKPEYLEEINGKLNEIRSQIRGLIRYLKR